MIRAIGPYQLVRRLGRGGMAEVHLALAHGASGFERHVAIKMLAPELAGEPELERALIREATLAGTLHHRNLVAVLGLGVHDGSYYVVMEYVDGTDLARHLDGTAPPFGGAAGRGQAPTGDGTAPPFGGAARRGQAPTGDGTAPPFGGAAGRGQAPTGDGALPEPLALHVVHELAIGLGYLHAAAGAQGLPLGLVHRDVGPANVLVSTTGDVKLGDFGIAKATALADLTAAGARKGRYAYMAPEQLAGEPVTGAADQFGLGVTLVELATGARPFAGEAPWTLRDAIRGGLLPAGLEGLAPDLAAIAARALAFEARDRYASVDELRAAIAEAQRRRAPATAIELGAWVRARIAAG